MKLRLAIYCILSIVTATNGFCSPPETGSGELKDKAQIAARSLPKSELLSYLNCYALEPTKKAPCQNDLNAKNIDKADSLDKEFIKEFTYEAEKLGFKAFIETQNFSCRNIENGPIFDVEKKQYKVVCLKYESYYMYFDYDLVKWNLSGKITD